MTAKLEGRLFSEWLNRRDAYIQMMDGANSHKETADMFHEEVKRCNRMLDRMVSGDFDENVP